MAEEKLDPELEPWVEETDVLGSVLKHPLVFQVPLSVPGLANRALGQKKAMLERALDKGDWHSYIWIHERPYRFEALMRLIMGHPLSDEDRHDLIRDVWIDSENIWQHLDEWVELFESADPEMLMTDEEKDRLAALPERVPIYRGAVRELNEEGLSWTLDHNRALWFARRFSDQDERVVIHAHTAHYNVMALFESRSEDEIIVLPDDIAVSHYEEL